VRLFNRRAAFWAAMFLALSPFMVRFAQEARMYGVVAFFTTLASYYLVCFIQERKNKFLLPYGLAMFIAVYTQYYAFFVMLAHWLIISLCTPGFWEFRWQKSIKEKLYLFNPYWWLTSVALLILYLPWFPVAYKQVTRVSTSYWIQPDWITMKTIPNSILQFTVFSHLDVLYDAPLEKILYWLIVTIFIGFTLGALFNKKWRGKVLSLVIYGYLPMILVFIVSKLKTPIYQDRYFPFSAVAIFALWGVSIAWIKNKSVRVGMALVILLVLIVGNYYMHHYTNHQMRQVFEAVSSQLEPGDNVVSGELYTFLDGIYYFGDGNLHFLSAPVDGYGETSLFYDQQEKYLVSQGELKQASNRIFVIGRTGDKEYFDEEYWSDYQGAIIFEENGLKAVCYSKD